MAAAQEPSERMDLDALLVEELGQLGRFQARTILLALLAVAFSAFHAEYVFTAARIETRCVIPECDGDQPEFTPAWLSSAVPTTSAGTFDNCRRFGTRAGAQDYDNTTCPAALFDSKIVVPCQAYVYKNTLTVVYDYELACEEWSRTLIGTVRTFGTLAALPITGFVSDRWGRRGALSLNAFSTALVGLSRYWVTTYIAFMISQCLEAVVGGGVYSCVYILVLELVGPKYRVATGAFLSSCFAIGQVAMGLIAWAVPSWKPLTLALYIPQLITIAYFWMIPESVRWYMSKGRFEESEALLKEVARVNGKKLSEKSLEKLRRTVEEDKNTKVLSTAKSANEPWLIVRVFRHKKVLLRCLVSPVWWITMTFIYYGLSINAVNMSGNQYVNYIAVASAEIPGFWIAVLLLKWFGRKPVVVAGFWACAACQIAYIFMPNNMYVLSLVVYLIGKSSISTVVMSLYLYTTELYPTECRHSLFAFSSMLGRIGSITAPLTPAIGAATFKDLPFVLFGGFALLSGCLVLLTPETRGTRLPDTMHQAETLGDTHQNHASQGRWIRSIS